MGGRAGKGRFASKADLLQAMEREEERGEVGRKIIDPPNMGTKSDPKIKITSSKRKRGQAMEREFRVQTSLLCSCAPPSCCLNKKSSRTTH